jgi:hypothetical protein
LWLQSSPGKKVWETPFEWKKAGCGSVGIDNLLVLKTDTQETENLDKTIFS